MPPQSQPPQAPPPQPDGAHPAYDFIMNPEAAPKRPLFSADSTLKRVATLVGGLVVLVVLALVVKSIIVGKPKLQSMVTVAQDQQEMIHLANSAAQQQNLSTVNSNVIATLTLTMNSSQSQLLAYLSSNSYKVNNKILALGISSSIDQQLSNSAAAGTYNQTLQDTLKTQLNNYVGDLQQSFSQIKGKKGRALLSSDYNQANLLLNQLDVPGE